MISVERAFDSDGKVLMAFVPAGYPSIEKTAEFIRTLDHAGVDLIEIGIPFSDPVVEGVTIQETYIEALKAGIKVDDVFNMVESLRNEVGVPLLFKTYLNPVFHIGYDKFCKRCEQVGVAGLVISDLPYEEKDELKNIAEKYGIVIISDISPAPKQRIEEIASKASGFLNITYPNLNLADCSKTNSQLGQIMDVIDKVKAVPVLICVNEASVQEIIDAAQIADGVLIEVPTVGLIAEHKEKAGAVLDSYISELRRGLDTAEY